MACDFVCCDWIILVYADDMLVNDTFAVRGKKPHMLLRNTASTVLSGKKKQDLHARRVCPRPGII